MKKFYVEKNILLQEMVERLASPPPPPPFSMALFLLEKSTVISNNFETISSYRYVILCASK